MLPGLAVLGEWTRAHLIDLPGMSGGGEPPHELSVAEYADAVAGLLDAQNFGPVLLAGQSSGTQVAAQAGCRAPHAVAAVVLVCPTIDPAARHVVPVLWRWWVDRRREPVSLDEVHAPERRRVGWRRLWHVLRVHLRHDMEQAVLDLRVPVLVICGADDPISPPAWGRRLSLLAGEGSYAQVPGPHTFCWRYPGAWSTPIRQFTDRLASADDSRRPLGTEGP
jgi:pimeloyl-ACP methyl ester carboxylesterase